MHIDKALLKKSISASPCSTVSRFADKIGLHRNTVYHYLNGGSPYQKGFLRLCQSLQLEPDDLIQKDKTPPEILSLKVAELVDHLHQNFPDLSFVLFGSRSKRTANPFSDWDIGFFSQHKISHQTHLNLLKNADEFLESSLEVVELINLNEADSYFLKSNSDSLVFLTGKRKDWILLLRSSYSTIHNTQDDEPRRGSRRQKPGGVAKVLRRGLLARLTKSQAISRSRMCSGI